MKRLKYKLLGMDSSTSTYVEMYEGTMTVVSPVTQDKWEERDSIYYYDDIGFDFERTNKLALDKPTITIMIPVDMLLYQMDNIYINDLCEYFQQVEREANELKDKDISIYSAPIFNSKIGHSMIAMSDYCLRSIAPYIDLMNRELYNRSRPDDENGKYYIYEPGPEMLFRNTSFFSLCAQKDYEYGTGNTVYLENNQTSKNKKVYLCIKLQVQLPKRKLRKTIQMLCRDLPYMVEKYINEFNYVQLGLSLSLAEKQYNIRNWLKTSEYCAFIANGSILPRKKGSDSPMPGAIPFTSPPNDEVEICGITGMGIKRGVTVITGGGYSGKSTLLNAISSGIYPHVLGDGRELCITDESAMTITAEDGRSVKNVNISPFIKWLPSGNTSDFSTDHASGSTSQATNIMEAIDYGAKLLLVDEDRSATNFMIRDRVMKELIKKEPITPFTDRAIELYLLKGVSTILVIGGSSEYLSVANKIYMMNNYIIDDVTEYSKELCKNNRIEAEKPISANWEQARVLLTEGFTSYPKECGSERLEIFEMGGIEIGDEFIDVRGINDIATKAQIDAIGFMIRYLEVHKSYEKRYLLIDQVNKLYDLVCSQGVDVIYSDFFPKCSRFLDMPRKYELLSAINRMRKISYSIPIISN